MPTTVKYLLPLAAVLAVGGCVPIEEARIPQGALRPDQRTAIVVFLSPGPWVTQEEETKAESAAKFLPGVGQLMQSVHDDQDFKVSNEFRQAYANWPNGATFSTVLAEELRKTGYPGTLVTWQEAGAAAPVIERFNRASDVLDWRRRYLVASPLDLKHLRDYSTILELDGHLILEVNLEYGLANNAEGNVHPVLGCVGRLYRANTMKLMWSRSETARDKSEPKNIYEYKVAPQILSEKFDQLMPALAQSIAADLRVSIPAAPEPAGGEGPASIGSSRTGRSRRTPARPSPEVHPYPQLPGPVYQPAPPETAAPPPAPPPAPPDLPPPTSGQAPLPEPATGQAPAPGASP